MARLLRLQLRARRRTRRLWGVAFNYSTEMCSGSEAGSYLRPIDVCITQL